MRDRSLGLSLLALAALPLLLFYPALFGGKMLWGADIETLEFAFKHAARRSLEAGEWPLWMPELLGGMPGIAASNLVFLHPSELLITMLGLPAWAGFGLDSALQLFLSGCGMLLFLRRQGLSPAACLLGAFFFAFSGTQISILFAGHINNTKAIAMIPWCFWAAHRRSWSWLGAAFAMQILGIGMQIFAYTILGVAAYLMWLNPRGAWLRTAGGFAASVALAALLSAPQLWLSLQYKPWSWREGFSYDAFTSWSFHPKEAIGWLIPGYYGWRQPTYRGDWPFCLSTEYFGMLPWALAAAALPGKKPALRFLGFLAVASFLIGIGKWTPIHHLFYRLPVYSGFRTWTRFLCLLTFAVCAMAAYGWDALSKGQGLKWAWGLCALALLLALFSMKVDQESAGKALALSVTLALGLWALSRGAMLKLALLLAIGLHAWDQSAVAKRYLEFRNPHEITAMPPEMAQLPDPRQPEPYRILELPNTWPQNRNLFWGFESLSGYHGVQMAGALKLQQAMQQRSLDWIHLMNVRYVISRENGALKIQANPAALPRAWLVARARTAKDEAAAYAALADPAFKPAEEAVLMEELKLPGGRAQGSVRWLKRTPNRFSLEVEAAQDSLLMVSNSYYPSWKAALNGAPARVLRADAALQAVAVPKGRHTLEFHYGAGLFYAAIAAFFVGLGCAIILAKEGR